MKYARQRRYRIHDVFAVAKGIRRGVIYLIYKALSVSIYNIVFTYVSIRSG